MTVLEPVIFSGITVIPLVNYPVILNGINRSHSAGLAGHFERDYARGKVIAVSGFAHVYKCAHLGAPLLRKNQKTK
jgi:hypothetical protein